MKYGERDDYWVQYKNMYWRILYDTKYTEDFQGLQIVPEEPLNTKISIPNDDNIENSINIFNNLTKTLNDACVNSMKNLGIQENGIVLSIRNIGTNPILNKKDECETVKYEGHDFLNNLNGVNYNEFDIYTTGRNLTDMNKLMGIKDYKFNSDMVVWYATSKIEYEPVDIELSTGGMVYQGIYGYIGSMRIDEEGTYRADWYQGFGISTKKQGGGTAKHNILPVITLQQGVLETCSGDGKTRETAYKLD